MIYIAADKHGFKTIQYVEEYLKTHKYDFINVGVQDENEDISLEEMIPKVTDKVRENENNKGILSCGTGVGVEVGTNKFSGIRACLATNEKIAEWSVTYDNCNVLCLVGWDTDRDQIFKILNSWFSAKYDGSEKRLKMMKVFDMWH